MRIPRIRYSLRTLLAAAFCAGSLMALWRVREPWKFAVWDIAAVAGFFNMSNRVASATDMRPNAVYHGQSR